MDDVDDDEDAEQVRLEGGGGGAAAAAAGAGGDSPAPHTPSPVQHGFGPGSLSGSPSSSVGAECSQGEEADANARNAHSAGASALPLPPLHPVFPEEKLVALQQQAHCIKACFKEMAGAKTYKTTWKLYRDWHQQTYGQAAPISGWTGLIWLTFPQANQFVGWMASTGKTSQQVLLRPVPLPTAAPLPLLLPATRYSLLATFPATPTRYFPHYTTLT